MPTAIDLFSGAGGLSTGLGAAGFTIRAAVEIDRTSASTYAHNHSSTSVMIGDIRRLTGPALLRWAGLSPGGLDLLSGCPPCQGFSTLRTRRLVTSSSDPRNDLVLDILRLVRSMKPRAVLVENVPGLAGDCRFHAFRKGLAASGYSTEYSVLDAQDFGVPQRRKRLVLVGLLNTRIPANIWSKDGCIRQTVRDAIGQLPHAGTSGDPLHDLPEQHGAIVAARIAATPNDGGSQRDVAARLRCACHRRSDGYSDVYGRMAWDEVAPTITTGCHNPSRGRFLHPVENRAITLREAALIQSFPKSYYFDLSRGKEHAALQIGNAFPPRLIEPIARRLIQGLAQ